MTAVMSDNAFDQVADRYTLELERGIGLSGESADFFMNGRVQWLAEALSRHGEKTIDSILDFGCGTGNAVAPLVDCWKRARITGLDPSAKSIAIAEQRYPAPEQFRWLTSGSSIAEGRFDLAYTSGVFHHIRPEDRDQHLSDIFRWVRPGGWLAFFENNPWNPGTRWVMSRISFDRDAICLSIRESNRRLAAAGFEIVEQRSLFYFPNCVRQLRILERPLSYIPLGAQYVVLARRP